MAQDGAKAMRGFGLGQAALLGAAVWVASLSGALMLGEGPWARGLVCGVVTGGLGGVVGFGLTVPALGKPLNAVLASMSLGFLARLILVAAGLVVTIRSLDGEPLGFVLAFFPLFFVFAALELLVVARHAQANRPGAAQES